MGNLILNRKAKFDYDFLKQYEAGVVLFGSEVKAIKLGKSNFSDSFCYLKNNEMFLKNFMIPTKDEFFGHQENRDKKLLLHKSEIHKIEKSLNKGLTIIPIRLYLSSRNKIKCEIAIAKGKKNYDKRQAIKKRDIDREIKNLK